MAPPLGTKTMKSLLIRSSLLVCLTALQGFACSSEGGVSSANGGSGGSATSSGGATGSGGTTGDVTDHVYTYADPNIVYSGRILFADGKAPRFSAPAVTISARFKGVGASMKITDNASTANFFDAIIDEKYADATRVKADDNGVAVLASGLPYGEHKVTVVKRTEANTGTVDFRSFTFQGEILPPPAPATRKIEIIGDSISVGSGNEAKNGSSECNDDYGRPWSNASKSWGPLLARKVDAEYHVTAVPGIGALRNYQCGDANTMPVVYDRIFLERTDSPLYDHSQFVPDAVLMMIGTNDFSPDSCNKIALSEQVDPVNYAAFIKALEDFLTVLRGNSPNAEVFLLSSPMLHDGWPDATYTSDTSQRAAITTAASELNATPVGAGKIHVISADYSTTKISGRGCGTHPNVYEHGIIAGEDSTKPSDPIPADLILNPVKTVMGW
jgi:lysophospholipase L1-like esterase